MSSETDSGKPEAENEEATRDEAVLLIEEGTTYTDSLSEQPATVEEPRHDSSDSRPTENSFLVQLMSSRGPPQIMMMLMLMTIGMGSVMGVMPGILTDRYARLDHGYTGEKNCSEFTNPADKPEACALASSDAENAASVSNFVSSMLAFVSSTLVGSLSDEHGRRTLLLLGVFLDVLSAWSFAVVQLVPTMSPNIYFAIDAASGLIDWSTVALSSLADVIPPEWRAPSFGILLAGNSVGLAIAPMLGLLFDNHSHLVLFSVSVVTLAFLVTFVFFPETLLPERAQHAREARLARADGMTTSQQYLNTATRPFWELLILTRSQIFRILSFLAFFSGMVDAGDGTLLMFYVVDRFSFDDKDMAVMIVLTGLLGIVIQGVLLKPLNDCLGEKLLLTVSFLFGAVTNVFYGIARNKITIFVAVGFSAFNSMTFPAISAVKANNAEETEQGRIQGALCSIQALASALGPVFLRFVYEMIKNKSSVGPGAMFLVAAGLYAMVSCVACALPSDQANSRPRRGYVVVSTDDDTPRDENHVIAHEESAPTGDYSRMEE